MQRRHKSLSSFIHTTTTITTTIIITTPKSRGNRLDCRRGENPAAEHAKKGYFMKKKSRIEIAREIIASLKREMQAPRLTESVRNGLTVRTRVAIEKPADRPAKA